MKPDGHSHSKARANLQVLTARLRERSHKVTGPRQAILEILRSHPHPLTNKEIQSYLPKRDCDLATIYRSMHLLESIGLVKRFDFGDGIARYELMGEDDDGHHHHLICTRCSEVVEIEECFPQDLEDRIGEKNGYTGISHKLEFFGLCPQCQST